MAGLSSALWITGSYIVAGLLFYIIMNFLTKGFINQYIKVKASRGALVLVECHDVTDTYFKAGKINTKRNLEVKDKQKKIHTFSNMDKNKVARKLGVNLIEVDLVNGVVIDKDFSKYTSYDLTMTDELVNRALMLPKLKGGDWFQKPENILLIIILIGVAVCVYLIASQPEPICNLATTGVNI